MTESFSLQQTARFFHPQKNGGKSIQEGLAKNIKQLHAVKQLFTINHKIMGQKREIPPIKNKLFEPLVKANLFRKQNSKFFESITNMNENYKVTKHRRNESEPSMKENNLVILQTIDIKKRILRSDSFKKNKVAYPQNIEMNHQILSSQSQIKMRGGNRTVQNEFAQRDIYRQPLLPFESTDFYNSMQSRQSNKPIPRSQSQQEIRSRPVKSFLQRRPQLKMIKRIFNQLNIHESKQFSEI